MEGIQDKEAVITRAWELLHTYSTNQYSSKEPSILAHALRVLAAHRQLLSLNVARAGLLLQALQSCTESRDPQLLDHALQHGLPVLARWAMQCRRPHAQPPKERALLQQAVAWLLNLLHSPASCSPPAPVVSASVLFLGAAYPGCVQELQAASASVTCTLLSPGPHSQPILELRDVEDVCVGVRLMLEQAMQEDPTRCEWLLACLITAIQHASEAGLQDFAGGRAAAASEQRRPSPATATNSTHTVTSSSTTTTTTSTTGSRPLRQDSSNAVHDGGVLWPPGTSPSLRSSCSDHRTARQASMVAAMLRQLGAAAVQTLGSSLLLGSGRQAGIGTHGQDTRAGTGTGGGVDAGSHGTSTSASTSEQAGAGSRGTVPQQQQGLWVSRRPQVHAASTQQQGLPHQGMGPSPWSQARAAGVQQHHGVQGGPQRRAGHKHGGLARSACLVQSVEGMAGLLEHGSTCLGEDGSSMCPGNAGIAGPSMHATAAVSLMAAAGLLEGLQVQLHSPTQAHIRTQLQLTMRRLIQPIQQALRAAACARLMRPHTLGSCPFPHPPSHQYSSCPPCQPPTMIEQGLTGSSSFQQTSSAQAGAQAGEQFLKACYSGQLARYVWPELVGAEGLTVTCAVPAAHAVPPLASPMLAAMVQPGRELLPWVVGILAGRLLALPQLMHALLPSSQHPFFVQQALQQRPASTPAVAAAAAAATAPHLRELLLRSMLPSLAACALLECSLGLDLLELLVLEAAPPEKANSWLQGLAADDDPLFRDAPALARCVVNAVAHPPLSLSPPSSPHNKAAATSMGASNGAFSQNAHPQAPSAGIAQGEDRAWRLQEGDYTVGEVMRVCQCVGLESLLDALQRGGARASARYASVALHAPPCWLSSLNGAALRNLMDRLFVSAVAPLPALLSAWPRIDPQKDHPAYGPNVTHSPPHAQQHDSHDSHDSHHHQQQQNVPHSQQHHSHHQQQQDVQHAQLTQVVGQGCCRSRASARMLLLLGHLQFCRVQLPMLAGLIPRLVWEVVQEPAGCAAFLDGMPSYQELLQPVFGVGAPTDACQGLGAATGSASSADSSRGVGSSSRQGATPVWMVDAVLGARLLFMLPIAATCVGRVFCPHEAAEQLLPSLYLLLKHPQLPVFEAAHAAFGAVVRQLGEHSIATSAAHQQQQQQQPQSHQEGRKEGQSHQHHLHKWLRRACARAGFGAGAKQSMSDSAAHEKGVDVLACMRVAQQTLPYYVQRSLQPPWGAGHISAFERTLPEVLSVMPPASPITLYCLVYVLEAASSWIHAHPHHSLDFSPLYGGHSSQQQQPQELHPGTHLASLACNLVLLSDWQLLPQVLDGASRLVRLASPLPPPIPPETTAPSAKPTSESVQSMPPSAAPDAPSAASLAAPSGVKPAPAAQQTALLQYLHDQLLRSNDYARKELLAKWLFGLAGDLRAGVPRQGGAGKALWHGAGHTVEPTQINAAPRNQGGELMGDQAS